MLIQTATNVIELDKFRKAQVCAGNPAVVVVQEIDGGYAYTTSDMVNPYGAPCELILKGTNVEYLRDTLTTLYRQWQQSKLILSPGQVLKLKDEYGSVIAKYRITKGPVEGFATRRGVHDTRINYWTYFVEVVFDHSSNIH